MQCFERFKRAHRVPDRFGGDFCVLSGGRQLGVAEQNLDHPYIRVGLQQMRGEAVPQRM